MIYADFNCPYSYAMSERLRGLEDRLEWRMVEHAPEAPVPMAGGANLAELEEVRRAAPEVELNTPPGLPNSGLASRALAALPVGRRVSFLHGVFRTLWVDGRDISSRAVLEKVAGQPLNSGVTSWQAEWERLSIGVPAILRDDGARCLGIVPRDRLLAFLGGAGGDLEGVY